MPVSLRILRQDGSSWIAKTRKSGRLGRISVLTWIDRRDNRQPGNGSRHRIRLPNRHGTGSPACGSTGRSSGRGVAGTPMTSAGGRTGVQAGGRARVATGGWAGVSANGGAGIATGGGRSGTTGAGSGATSRTCGRRHCDRACRDGGNRGDGRHRQASSLRGLGLGTVDVGVFGVVPAVAPRLGGRQRDGARHRQRHGALGHRRAASPARRRSPRRPWSARS